MTAEEFVVRVVDALNALKIPYMLVGSFSSNYYGVPRSSQDADFVVQFGQQGPAALMARLKPEIQFDPQMSFETVTGTWRHVAGTSGTRFKIEFFLAGDDPYDRERFSRRREVETLGRRVFISSPEDVVVTKLRWSQHGKRRKDMDDVKNVLAVQGDRLDWPYIVHWCDQHGTRDLLEQLRDESGV